MAIGHHHAIEDFDGTFRRGFDRTLFRATLRRAADVEGAHGQLRARLTDGLRGDNANRFTDIHRRTAGEVAAIAQAAHTLTRITGQHGADFHLLHARFFDALRLHLINQLMTRDDDLTRFRISHIFLRGTAQDAFRKRGNHFRAIHRRTDGKPAFCAAIGLHNDAILRHIHQTPRQIT